MFRAYRFHQCLSKNVFNHYDLDIFPNFLTLLLPCAKSLKILSRTNMSMFRVHFWASKIQTDVESFSLYVNLIIHSYYYTIVFFKLFQSYPSVPYSFCLWQSHASIYDFIALSRAIIEPTLSQHMETITCVPTGSSKVLVISKFYLYRHTNIKIK